MTPLPLKDDLKALSTSYPVPAEPKLLFRMSKLDRMHRFYVDKIPQAPERQAGMFQEFCLALMYAMSTIKMYRKLTHRLAELAEEADDENRTDRQS